jgi:predicted  nucleic acid-binding Zn-ribbon protein
MREERLWQRAVRAVLAVLIALLMAGVTVPAQAIAQMVGDFAAVTTTSKLTTLREGLVQAQSNERRAQDRLATAQSELEKATEAYDEALVEEERLGNDTDQKSDAWNRAEEASSSAADELVSAQAKLDKNTADIDGVSGEISQAESDQRAATTALDQAKSRVATAQARLQAAQDAVDAAEAVIAAEVPDPRSNEGHREWTAYGFFQYVRDNAAYGSAQYWDAQCAMDILDGGVNTTGHAYPRNQGPEPDGDGASTWAHIASNIAWAQRGDAVGLDNFRTSLALLEEFNAVRAEENAAEGTSLRTDIGTNCRQMAISIVQCDTSKDYGVSHTSAYEGLENLSWSSMRCVPFSRNDYTDPYYGWYDEEKIDYQQQTGGVTGHYTTIVDLNSGYYCEIAGFAVCNYQASYGECRELSTFGDFFSYDSNPTPEAQYAIADMTSMFDTYYDMQVEAEMFGTTEADKAEHRAALAAAQDELNAAKSELAEANAAQVTAQGTLDAVNQHLADARQRLSNLQGQTQGLESDVANKTSVANQKRAVADAAKTAYDAAKAAMDKYAADRVVANAKDKLGAAQRELDAAESALEEATVAVASAQVALDDYTNLSENTAVVVTCADATYTGEALEPEVTVTVDGVALVAGTDYTVAFQNNTAAGTGTVVVTGASAQGSGGWWGACDQTFAIRKADIATAEVSRVAEQTFAGKALKPAISATFGGRQLVEGDDYTVTYDNNVNVGTAAIAIAGKGNFQGTAGTEFAIVPASLDTATIAPIPAQTYTGAELTPAVDVVWDAMTLAPSDFDVTYENNVNAGSASVAVTGKGNFVGSLSAGFVINKAAQRIDVPATLTKTVVNAAFALGAKLGLGDGALSYASSKPGVATIDAAGTVAIVGAGKTTITVTAAETDNYQRTSAKVALTVNKLASSIKLQAQSKPYTGKAQAYSGKVTKKGSNGAVTYKYFSDAKCTKGVAASKVKAAGTYYVKATLAADGTYAAATSAAVKLIIAKAANPLTLKAVNRTAKLASVKKAAVAVARPITVSKAQGALKYKKASGSAALSVNAKTGKVTVKKGTKKGTYKIKITVTAAGNANYKAGSKSVTCAIVVK